MIRQPRILRTGPRSLAKTALLALPVAYLTSAIPGRTAVPLVAHLRTGALEPVLTAAPFGAHAARTGVGSHRYFPDL